MTEDVKLVLVQSDELNVGGQSNFTEKDYDQAMEEIDSQLTYLCSLFANYLDDVVNKEEAQHLLGFVKKVVRFTESGLEQRLLTQLQ